MRFFLPAIALMGISGCHADFAYCRGLLRDLGKSLCDNRGANWVHRNDLIRQQSRSEWYCGLGGKAWYLDEECAAQYGKGFRAVNIAWR
ncbi:hypothetical protein F66182_3319 [Fusarium sp. NRRL 66182]|nr:hypothetical protein F66182_3319 [Fusarium sp. NRRL 66182]